MISPRRPLERWLFGFAVLFTAILVVSHSAEESAIVALLQTANVPLLSLAILLQLATYTIQSATWRRIASRGGAPLSLWDSTRFTFAKLFIDQSLPSGGLSGTAFVTQVLRQRGGAEERIIAGAILNILAFQAALVLGLLLAISLALWFELPTAVPAGAILLILPALFIVGAVILLHQRGIGLLPALIGRSTYLRDFSMLIEHADGEILRSRRAFFELTMAQLGILIFDALTLWAAIESLGGHRSPSALFPAFMVASAVKTFGFVPGGIGVFEAASTAVMTSTGLDPTLALSGTLIFRGLSYWIPMAPGFLIARSFKPKKSVGGPAPADWWSSPPTSLLTALRTTPQGLSSSEAATRIFPESSAGTAKTGLNLELRLFLKQLRSPLLMLLVFAAIAAALSGEWADSIIVLLIIAVSVGLAAAQESNAERAVRALRSRIAHHVQVVRDGVAIRCPATEIVPGDIIALSAGNIVPADGVLLSSNALFLNEAALTGEPFPIEKRPGVVAPTTPITERTNTLFAGSHVLTGSGTMLAVITGGATTFGAIAESLERRPGPTEFERSTRHFGYLVLSCMAALTCLIFFLNVQLGRAPIETLLFSVALAVSLSPELLPAILTINLARGAGVMASAGVLTRHTNGIENLGAIDILCTDKTGTITAGVIDVGGSFNHRGEPDQEVLALAAVNAALQSGFVNPLDVAIVHRSPVSLGNIKKIGEIGYDFSRKRISVVVERDGQTSLITKGSFESILSCCKTIGDGSILDEKAQGVIREHFQGWSKRGMRVLAVGERGISPAEQYTSADEQELIFRGFITFVDAPKSDAAGSIRDLKRLGIDTRIVSGDNALVCHHVAEEVGIPSSRIMTGSEIRALHGPALWQAVEATHVFAEIEPAQKEDIVIALKRLGHVVGFLGDGINDTPAMHAADVSISVEGAVDIARESADFVLLEPHLDILRRGVAEGRRTFVNTLKYIRMTMSANLGNTLSMAIGSIFLPFLPLLPGQILLNNFLSDIPALGLAGDTVDPELVASPERWHLGNVARFMLVFGLISSCFDLVTFWALLVNYGLDPASIRTGWFLESLFTELIIVLIVRTHRPILKSRPSRFLLWSVGIVALVGLAIPCIPAAHRIGFTTLSPWMFLIVVAIVFSYATVSEITKRFLFRKDPSM